MPIAPTSTASIASKLNRVALNPQPLPPRFDAVLLNPQPLPPNPGDPVMLNPQPLPPRFNDILLNPQPLPPNPGDPLMRRPSTPPAPNGPARPEANRPFSFVSRAKSLFTKLLAPLLGRAV